MPGKSKTIKISDRKGDKPWLRKQKPHRYAIQSRLRNKTFLIVCEGQTEEQYFRSFPVLSATVHPVQTGNSNTVLVDEAIRLQRKENYDEVWCVFDFDVNPLIEGQGKDFNQAIRTAQDRGFHCAYSNDSFELWFVLHYQYLDQQFHRTQFYQALSRYWGVSYERVGKTLTFARDIYRRLADDSAASQVSAIGHARRLLALQEGKPCHLQNPVTTVFKLVERLNEHCRR